MHGSITKRQCRICRVRTQNGSLVVLSVQGFSNIERNTKNRFNFYDALFSLSLSHSDLFMFARESSWTCRRVQIFSILHSFCATQKRRKERLPCMVPCQQAPFWRKEHFFKKRNQNFATNVWSLVACCCAGWVFVGSHVREGHGRRLGGSMSKGLFNHLTSLK